MQCPHCAAVLVTLEFADTEVDYCYACGGIWLDAGELEQLLAAGGDDAYRDTATPTRVWEKPRRCPLCRRRMEKIALGTTAPILLDRCRAHGIWFDAGELKKVLAAGCAQGRESRLVRLLDEMFAGLKKSGGYA